MSDTIKKCCYNCQHFKIGQLRKTFEGRVMYHKGNCRAIDNEIRPTLSTAGQLCELYKQALNATSTLPEYFKNK